MKYLGLLKRDRKDLAGKTKSLFVRATGRFYTPEAIGRCLARAIVRVAPEPLRKPFRIIDPFAGDGRLVVWLAEEWVRAGRAIELPWAIDLWDCDELALRRARKAIHKVGSELGVALTVRCSVGDSFQRALSARLGYDIVITNPPWEVLKPDRRELTHMTAGSARKYVAALRERDVFLTKNFPHSQPKRRFSGWGTNLARCGTELALTLSGTSGISGIVSPASLLADEVSGPLRRWLFESYSLADVAFYPAEARLFEGVDQPVISMTASRRTGKPQTLRLTLFDKHAAMEAGETMLLNEEHISGVEHALPILFGSGPLKLLPRWSTLPTLGTLEGPGPSDLWAGRELDETNHRSYLARSGDHPFLKGRMVGRYRLIEAPTEYVRPGARRIPPSVRHARIVWRDVSRPNQRRRLQAALIPAGWVSGNSVNVAYFRDANENRLRALLAIFNSFVFEYQVRAYLATAHVSLTTVRKIRLPTLDNHAVGILAPLVAQHVHQPNAGEDDLEVTVARLYGLNRDDFRAILSSFTKVTQEDRDRILSSSSWDEPL